MLHRPNLDSLTIALSIKMSTYLFGISSTRVRLDLAQHFADVKNAVDQHSVGGPLDLEVAKESVCSEEREDLIKRIV